MLDEVRLTEEDVEYLHASVRAELPRILARLNAAGYDGDYDVLGAGMTSVVLRDRRTGYALKVARDAAGAETITDEYEFLVSLEGTSAAKYLPAVYQFDALAGVLVREGVEGRPGSPMTRGLQDVFEVIVESAKRAGWTRPEFKENSFIVREDGSIVMVDVGFALRTGHRLVAYVERVLSSPVKQRRVYADLAWALRMDAADGLIPVRIATELQARMEAITGDSLG